MPHKAYKAIGDWIITLVPSEINNEGRKLYDPLHAYYRCTEALVLSIEHRWDSELKRTKISSYYCGWDRDRRIYHLDTLYKVGEITKCDEWDSDLSKTYTHGIHYFLHKNTARCHNCFMPEDLTGVWELYDEEGKPRGWGCGVYKDGKNIERVYR